MFLRHIDIGGTRPMMFIAGHEKQYSYCGITMSIFFFVFIAVYSTVLF
jgi:hypothetical protein